MQQVEAPLRACSPAAHQRATSARTLCSTAMAFAVVCRPLAASLRNGRHPEGVATIFLRP